MKPKLDFDPDLPVDRRAPWSGRGIVRERVLILALTGLVALGWMPMNGMGLPGAGQARNGIGTLYYTLVPNVPAGVRVTQLDDRFVVIAREDIDPSMVHRADPGIDPAMVITNQAGRRVRQEGGANPLPALPVPKD